jgi:tape measure domain-containing protein
MPQGGNIANLNIQVTSNIQQAQIQLNNLQKTLQSIKGGGNLFPNIKNLVGSLNTTSSSMSSINQQFVSMQSSGNAITNMLLGWVALGPKLGNSFSKLSDTLYNVRAYREMNRSSPTGLPGTGTSFMNLIGDKEGKKMMAGISAVMTALRPITQSAAAGMFKTLSSPFIKLGSLTSTVFSKMGSTISTAMSSLEKSSFGKLFDTPRLSLMYLNDAMRNFGSMAGVQNVLKAFGAISSTIFSTFAVVGVAAVGYLTVKFTELIAKGLKYNAMIEQMRIGYEVMLTGGVSAANELMKRMTQFANVTPFTMPQVAGGAEMLLGYGVGEGAKNQVEQVTAAVQMLGDVSRGNVNKFNDMSYAFGQIYAMGRLQGQELRQLINAGWNPLLEISKKTGKSMGQLKTEMEDGAISVDMVTQALIDATSKGGRFFEMMKKQSESGIGLWSTITDKFNMAMGMGTIKLFDGLKPILKDLGYLLDAFLSSMDQIGDSITNNILPPLQIAFKQLLQLVNLTDDGKTGFNNITTAVELWTTAMGNGIKFLMIIVNLGALMTSIFVAGLASIGMAMEATWSGGALILQNLVLGIIGLFEWCWKEVYNLFVDIVAGKVTDFLGGALGGVLARMLPKLEKYENTTATWDLLGNMNTASKKQFMDSMQFLMDTAQLSSGVAKNAISNLFGDVSGVDEFLKKIRTIKSEYNKADPKSLLGGKIVEDLTKATEAANKMGQSILSLVDKLVNMGNVFEKLSYEKFSPYKLMIRMQRFFDEMKSWTGRLATLATQGVPEHMIEGLRGMGVQGYGITKALANASAEQRAQIVSQYEQSRGMAWGVAGQQARYEQVIVNVTGNSVVSPELVNLLTDEIIRKLRLVGA